MFGCIRQVRGPHDHPDALNFEFWLEKYLFGKDIPLLSDKANCSISDENLDPLPSETMARAARRDPSNKRNLSNHLFQEHRLYI